MPKGKAVTAGVEAVISANNGVIAKSGGVVPHFVKQMGGEVSANQVARALDRLENSGKVVLERRGRRYNRVTMLDRDRTDRFDCSPGAKKAMTFARGVPANLPDEWCSEVVVSHVSDRQSESADIQSALEVPVSSIATEEVVVLTKIKSEDAASVTVTPSQPIGLLEELNWALAALQCNTDKAGILNENSSASVIRRELGCSMGRARELNRRLKDLNVRTSTNLGAGLWQTKVDLSLNEITKEMLHPSSSAKVDEVAVAEVVPVDEVASPLEQQEQLFEDEVQLRLASIILDLKKQVESLTHSEAQARESETRIRESLDQKIEECTGLQARVADLERQLAKRTTPLPVIQEILDMFPAK